MRNRLIILPVLLLSSYFTYGQNIESEQHDKSSFTFSGQVSGWAAYTPDIATQIWLGGRFIPQLNYEIPFKKKKSLLDFEVSANILGELGTPDFADGLVKPYRLWARYSDEKNEIRLGLQKINFGSAQLFRPLMWFDKMDPRDPLQLTDGVYGLLYRHYFQNNANLWIWGLLGNDQTKGLEIFPSEKWFPELGTRFQHPIPRGEVALSYNFRKIGIEPLNPESKFGIDVRFDIVVGLWFEISWTHIHKSATVATQFLSLSDLKNQIMATAGLDYTFGIGSGLTAIFEQTYFQAGNRNVNSSTSGTFSGLSLSYPLSLFDNISAIVYYDWKNKQPYTFINWQRQFDNLALNTIAYWNPGTISLPTQSTTMRMAGKGIQIMLTYNF